MTHRRIILIDATQESIVPTFAQKPIFQTWLHCFDDIQNALTFINEETTPNSLDILLARDHVQNMVQLPGKNDPELPILELFCDLQTILHVTILCPDDNTKLEEVICRQITDRRMLNTPVAKINIPSYICKEGIQYLSEQITHYSNNNNEVHLTENIQKNRKELMGYLEDVINDQGRRLHAMQETYSNKPGEEPS